MKISVKIDRKRENQNGFPVMVVASNLGKRAQRIVTHTKENEWAADGRFPSQHHPDFMGVYTKMVLVYDRARSQELKQMNDVSLALDFVLSEANESVRDLDFFKFGFDLIEKRTRQAAAYNDKKRLSALGNLRVYNTGLLRMKDHYGKLKYSDINYRRVLDFKEYLQKKDRSNATVANYLRTYRYLYNEMCRSYELENKKPFVTVFKNLSSKSYRSKKKYLGRIGIFRLELKKEMLPSDEKYIDLFLLQFYLAGADLVDVYFLKKKDVSGGRVSFWRGKVANSPLIDLKLHSKAAEILDKYCPQDGEWIFPWRKDAVGYRGFRRRMYRSLRRYQDKYNVQVHPEGGHLGVKVARHTFANAAKQLGVDSEIRRELMGHMSNNVGGFYEDLHLVQRRDDALFRVIENVVNLKYKD
jgi:site-specific recombinase XerD